MCFWVVLVDGFPRDTGKFCRICLIPFRQMTDLESLDSSSVQEC